MSTHGQDPASGWRADGGGPRLITYVGQVRHAVTRDAVTRHRQALDEGMELRWEPLPV